MNNLREAASMMIDSYLNEAFILDILEKAVPEDDPRFVSDDHKIGLKYALSQWHSGQWSRGYRVMSSRLRNVPLLSTEQLNHPENSTAKEWASHYDRLFRKGSKERKHLRLVGGRKGIKV